MNTSIHSTQPLAPVLALFALLTLVAPLAHAEKADREKPINLEADSISMDDINKVQVFEGNVVMTQGTMQILTSKLVVKLFEEGAFGVKMVPRGTSPSRNATEQLRAV